MNFTRNEVIVLKCLTNKMSTKEIIEKTKLNQTSLHFVLNRLVNNGFLNVTRLNGAGLPKIYELSPYIKELFILMEKHGIVL